MDKLRLGRTGLYVTKTAMGCLPLQRRSVDDAVSLLRAAYDSGINYYDTANAYSDSEEKLGRAFEGMRHEVIISTKGMGTDRRGITEKIELSLRRLRTDYIDIYQFHNPQSLLDPGDPEGALAAVLEARQKGYIRYIGVTSHRLKLAEEHLQSGLYDTIQFPLSYLSTEDELAFAGACYAQDVGFIAMKGLCGGLLTNTRLCHAFAKSLPGVVPIWGIQTEEELRDWVALSEENPSLDGELRSALEADRRELGGSFCRGCNYCAGCPQDIEIWNSARMKYLLRRSPWRQYYGSEWREKMERINDCTECGHCSSLCPYGLDTPSLLREMLEDYHEFYELHKHEL